MSAFLLPGDEVLRGGERFLVDRLHPLLGQRAGVLDRLAAPAVGLALEHAARAELLAGTRDPSGSRDFPAPPTR